MVNVGPLTKKVIGAHVDPPTMNTARAVYANVTAFGTCDVATSGILTRLSHS